jgi:thiamine-phosphate pyrophosphorylase
MSATLGRPAFDREMLRVMAITDDLRDGREGLVARAELAVRGGATSVQLRLKDVDVRVMLEVARLLIARCTVPVLVNDRLDVALAAGAAGAHLGADDLPIQAARRIVPPGFVLGASLGSQDEIAGTVGADYVGVGPVFATVSKVDAGPSIGLEEMRLLVQQAGLPAVAIGGITTENAPTVLRAGADGVAVISAIFGSRDPLRATQSLRSAIGR